MTMHDTYFPDRNFKYKNTTILGDRIQIEIPCDGWWGEFKPGALARRVIVDTEAHGRVTDYIVRSDVEQWLYDHKMTWWAFEKEFERSCTIMFDCPKNAMLFKLTWL